MRGTFALINRSRYRLLRLVAYSRKEDIPGIKRKVCFYSEGANRWGRGDLFYHGINPSLRKAYNGHLKNYEAFCYSTGVSPCPTVVRILADCIRKPAANLDTSNPRSSKIDTIQEALEAVRISHIERDLPLRAFKFKTALDGIITGAYSTTGAESRRRWKKD